MTIPSLQKRTTPAALLLVSALLLSGCAPATIVAPEPLPASISVGEGGPEDLTVSGTSAYVSNIADGSVLKLDLLKAGASSVFIPPASDAYSSAWGLRVMPSQNWLLSLQNQPYDFNPANAKAGRLSAYDLTSGAKVKSWELPAGMVGNSVEVDKAGNIYVGDIGPTPRIVRIDPASGAVTIWATSPEWVAGGFGIGGMAYSGAGLYASHNNALWYIAIQPDGSAAAPQAVKVDGDPVIFADGMTWTGSNLIYAENDVLVPGPQGVVYQVAFSTPTAATRTALQTGLSDPSGVALAQIGDQHYLLVNESQLGFAFGVDKGEASKPYQVKVFSR
ncbi:hypothetical protein [Deinococcus sp.]|uniref:hypothetical protein n=1 Tax=Deinococcus sp. TaxID=47478 RepID=UPI003B59779F